MSSGCLDDAGPVARGCLYVLGKAGFFETSLHSTAAADSAVGLELAMEDDNGLEDQWRDTHDRRKAVWKLEAREEEQDVITATRSINGLSGEDVVVEDVPLMAEVGPAEDDHSASIDGETIA